MRSCGTSRPSSSTGTSPRRACSSPAGA
jgi:hypothetical protein